MALFKVVNNQAQLDAGDVASTDVYGAGIRFTQDGAARTTRFAGTAFNQGIPMSPTGQVAIVDATSGLPVDAIYLNGLPISGNKVCVSLNASSVISSGLPFDSNGVLVGSLSGFTHHLLPHQQRHADGQQWPGCLRAAQPADELGGL